MDLFSFQEEKQIEQDAPLAWRMRPQNLEEFIGQEKIVGKDKPLRRMIEMGKIPSLIFYGPPGTGKTTLARVIANTARAYFSQLSAVTAGVAELRKIVGESKERRGMYSRQTIVFIDEIHRFNKSQQDALLPHVEDGTLTLIGATTENPYFSVNNALLSRSQVYSLEALTERDIMLILSRALADEKRGLGGEKLEVEETVLEYLARVSSGDARWALNLLETATFIVSSKESGLRRIDLACVQELVQEQSYCYDKKGDSHYNLISAFIKSIRGSDPDGALYWYARMTQGGEDQRFILRRLIVHASEDIGMADPLAMLIVHAAWNALETVGLPEARIPIAQAIIYLSTAPKSNSVLLAIDQAMAEVKKGRVEDVPSHLRDAHYPGAAVLGHGRDYLYPHNHPDHYVKQDYLPSSLKEASYYQPSSQGREKNIVIKKRQ